MNNWEKLCKQIVPLIEKDVPEDLYHPLFKTFLMTIFGWEDVNIKEKVPVQMGTDTKEADIVLECDDYGIVIEMKRPSNSLGEKEILQLYSYMINLRHNFGLLIGNKVKLFYDDGNKRYPTLISEISFDPNDINGINLFNILDYNNCSKYKLLEYINEKMKIIKASQELELLKEKLFANNNLYIKEALKNKLLLEGYNEDIINNILNEINITISNQNSNEVLNTAETHVSNDREALTKYYEEWLKNKNTGYRIWICNQTIVVIDILFNGIRYAVDIRFRKNYVKFVLFIRNKGNNLELLKKIKNRAGDDFIFNILENDRFSFCYYFENGNYDPRIIEDTINKILNIVKVYIIEK